MDKIRLTAINSSEGIDKKRMLICFLGFEKKRISRGYRKRWDAEEQHRLDMCLTVDW